MKSADVSLNTTYHVLVSNRIVPVLLVRRHPSGHGWLGRNLITNREVYVRTAARLRYPVRQRRDQTEHTVQYYKLPEGVAALNESDTYTVHVFSFPDDPEGRETAFATAEANLLRYFQRRGFVLTTGVPISTVEHVKALIVLREQRPSLAEKFRGMTDSWVPVKAEHRAGRQRTSAVTGEPLVREGQIQEQDVVG